MAKTYDIAADWREVDPSSLPHDLRIAYDAYKDAQRLASEFRVEFERKMADAAHCPTGQRLAFGYRFGKLSIAVIPDERPARKPSAQAQTLQDFLRSAQLNGSRT